MKTLKKLEYLLRDELLGWSRMNNENNRYKSLNQATGDASIYITSILQQHLSTEFPNWPSARWLDDAILTKVVQENDNRFLIWGVIIWGEGHTTNQWTDPFFFSLTLTADNNIDDYELLFSDADHQELNYETFRNYRGSWDQDFYATNEWSPAERNWLCVIKRYGK